MSKACVNLSVFLKYLCQVLHYLKRGLIKLCFLVLLHNIRGAFGKYVARSFFSVTDKHTQSCLVSF